MAEGTVVFTRRNGTISVLDATGTPLEYEVAYEDGELSVDIPEESLIDIMDRGQFTNPPQVRKDQDQPITGSFTYKLRDAGNATDATVFDLPGNQGVFGSTWVPTNGANAEVALYTLRLTLSSLGGTKSGTIDFPYCTFRQSIDESGGVYVGTINFTSRAVRPTVTMA